MEAIRVQLFIDATEKKSSSSPLKSHNLYVAPETVGHPSLQEEQPQQSGAMSV